MGPHRTDFTAESVFRRRWLHHQNDKIIGTTNVFVVPFDPDFNEFSAKVAFALRFLIVYRTDGGKFARGIVRASGWLKRVHDHLQETATPKGAAIRLLARLFRRRDLLAENRWVLTIEFALAKEDTISLEDDDGPVYASPEASDGSRCALINQIVHDTTLLFSDEDKFHGLRAQRVLKMLAIADRLGCQKAWDLWFYSDPVVFAYIQLVLGDPARRRMTAATGGRFPFDGDSGYDAAHVPWRTYPFRDAVHACMGRDRDACRANAAYQLAGAEKQLNLSIDAIFREKAKIGLVSSLNQLPFMDTFGSSLVSDFIDHIQSLITDPDSIYSLYQ